MVMQFPPATLANEVDSTQPTCGVNPVQYTLNQCNYTPAATRSLTEFATFNIAFSDGQLPVAVDARCVYYVHTWSGTEVTSGPVYSTTSRRGCSVTAATAALPYVYGGTSHTFEYARFDTGTLVNGPTCFVKNTAITSTSTSAAHVCSHTNIVVARPDPNSLQVSITGGAVIGLCRVELVTYGGSAPDPPVVEEGACNEVFNFIYRENDILYTTGVNYQFKYTYFDHSDVEGVSTCASSPTTAIAIPAYNCNSRSILQLPWRTWSVTRLKIDSPAPLTGTCSIRVVCNGFTGFIPFPDGCESHIDAVEENINTAMAEVGGVCYLGVLVVSYTYRHTSIDNVECVSSTSTTKYLKGSYPLKQLAPVGDERLRFTGDGLIPSGWGTYPYCMVELRDCNGVPSILKKFISDGTSQTQCAGIATFGSPEVPLDSVCGVHIQVWPSKATYPSAGAFLSDKLDYYSTAMGPVWDEVWVTQSIQVTGVDDYCLQVSWPVPSNPGASAITCYEVSRKDGAGEYYVIHSCDTELVEQPLSVISCTFETWLDYSFKVVAENSYSTGELVLTGVTIDDYNVVESFLACDDGLVDPTTPTSLTIAYVASGVFTVSVHDVRAMATLESCLLEITKYGSVDDLPTVSSSTSCSSFSFGPVENESLEFGETYKFRFRILNEHSEPMCETREVVTPAVCQDELDETSTMAVRKYPFNRLETTLTNPPAEGACAYWITQWNNSPLFEDIPGLTDCDAAPIQIFRSGDNMDATGAEQTFGALMVSFADDQADIEVDQPVCGVGPIEMTISPCTSTPAAVTSEDVYATFDISFAEPLTPETVVCQYYVQTWNGEDRTVGSPETFTTDAGCPSTPVTSTGAFPYGGVSPFEFELAQFYDGDTDGSASCWIPGNAISVTTPVLSCTASNLQYYWIDDGHARIMFDSLPADYGLCRVVLVDELLTETEVDFACDLAAVYDFTDAVELAAGKIVDFYFEFFADGIDDGGEDYDCSSESTPLVVTVSSYACGNVLRTSAGAPLFNAAFVQAPGVDATVFHTFGSCALQVTCGELGQVVLSSVSCLTTMTNVNMISAAVSIGSVLHGTICSLDYRYFTEDDGETPFCASTAATSVAHSVSQCRTIHNGLASISREYYANGDWLVDPSSAHVEAYETCRMQMTQYAGQQVGPIVVDDCGENIFTKPTGMVLTFGTESTFVFTVMNNGSDVCRSTTNPDHYRCQSSSPTTNSVLSVQKSPSSQLRVSIANPPSTGLCHYFLTKWNSVDLTDSVEPMTSPGFVPCNSVQYIKSAVNGPMDYGSHSVFFMRFAASANNLATHLPTCGVNSVEYTGGPCDYAPIAVVSSSIYATFEIEFNEGDVPVGTAVCVYTIRTWSSATISTIYSTTSAPGCPSTSVSEPLLAYEFGSMEFEFELDRYDSGVVSGSPSCYVDGSEISAIGRPALSCTSSNLRYHWIDTDIARITFDMIPETYGLCRVIFVNDADEIETEMDLDCDVLAEYDFTDAVELAAGKSVKFYFEYYGDGSDDGEGDEDCTSISTPLEVIRTDYACGTVDVSGDEVNPIFDFEVVPDIGAIAHTVYTSFGSCVLEVTCGVSDVLEINYDDCSVPLDDIDVVAIVVDLGDIR